MSRSPHRLSAKQIFQVGSLSQIDRRFRAGPESADTLRENKIADSVKTGRLRQQKASLTAPYFAPYHSAHSADASPLHPAPVPCHQALLPAICGDRASRSLRFAWIARASSAESWQPLTAKMQTAKFEHRQPLQHRTIYPIATPLPPRRVSSKRLHPGPLRNKLRRR